MIQGYSLRVRREPGDADVVVELRNAPGTAILSEKRTPNSRGAVIHEVHNALAEASPDEGVTLVITVKLGGEAMRRAPDVQHALDEALGSVHRWRDLLPGWGGAIKDGIGNTVGKWEVA